MRSSWRRAKYAGSPRHAEMRAPVLSGLTGSQFHRVAAVAVPFAMAQPPWSGFRGDAASRPRAGNGALDLRVFRWTQGKMGAKNASTHRAGSIFSRDEPPRSGRAPDRAMCRCADVRCGRRRCRGQPCATALATALRTRGSKRRGDDVVLVELIVGDEVGERERRGDLHLFVDVLRAHVKRAAEHGGERQHVVDLVREVAATGGDHARAAALASSGKISGVGLAQANTMGVLVSWS